MNIKRILESAVFQGLTEDRLHDFFELSPYTLRAYKSKEFVAMQNAPCQSLYLLYDGKVRTYMTGSDGKQITIEDLEALTLLAPAFLFGTDHYFPVDIVTLTPCEVVVINKEDFVKLMQQEPSVLHNFLRIISDRSILLSRKINTFALQGLKNRLADYLCKYGGIRNQQEVADRLGVARPSLSRVLAELAEEGCITLEKRKIILTNRTLLEKYL